MKRRWLFLRAIAAGFVFTMPVWASAPISGDAAQYATFDGTNPVILDRKTHLKWTRKPGPQSTFTDAKCASGRLPSLKELLTIFDEEPFPQYIKTAYEDRFIDERAFGPEGGDSERTPAGPFWTSSFANAGKTSVWTVDFKTGQVESTSASAQGWTRCVDTY
jgi:hypothetical protein